MQWLDNMEVITSTFGQIEERWNCLYEEIHKTDLKQQDLLHEIESGHYDVRRGYLKLKELQELRQYRRELKNEQSIIEPLYLFWKQHKGLEIDLFKVKKAMDIRQEQINNWVYNPRVGDDAECKNAV